MRLKHIKLAGFKSFVDATKVPFPDQMTCVVGPNGCGKSNVIDAVRWVLGESSAKNLRGDAMTDVIFNGSSARKPVSQASVELVFDNSSGRIQGEYASYQEISVKRQVTRDGQSNYYLNGSKCRRRDITDLFLGTGLGPRSYAIIEQGMISRLIESKPQELRVFIEEAAGISKYKERRRETANRMSHTRENLERITDVRDELGQQLEKLQRQAAAAVRFKELKAQERQLKGELYALRWLKLEQQRQQLQTQREQHETELEKWQAEQTGDERGVIERREQAHNLKQQVDDQQQQVFTFSTQVTQLEQQLQHRRQLQQQRTERQQQLQNELTDLQQQDEEDQQQLQQLHEQAELIEPQTEQVAEQLLQAEEQTARLEEQWQQWQVQQREQQQKQQQVQQQRQQLELQHQRVEQQQEHVQQQRESVTQQLQELAAAQFSDQLSQLESEVEQQQQRVAEADRFKQDNEQQLRAAEDNLKQLADEQQQARQSLHQQQARQQTLQQLLQQQQTTQTESTRQWLQHYAPEAKPLREVLAIDESWQSALEALIKPWLDSYWLPSAPDTGSLPDELLVSWPQTEQRSDVTVANSAREVVSGVAKDWGFWSLCVLADNLAEAQQRLKDCPHAIVAVTAAGDWLTRQSMHVGDSLDGDSVLQMHSEVATLAAELEQLEQKLEQVEEDYQQQQLTVEQLRQQGGEAATMMHQHQQQLTIAEQQRQHVQQQHDQQQQQLHKLTEQQDQLQQQLAEHKRHAEQLTAQLDEVAEQQQQLPDLVNDNHELEQRLRDAQQHQQQLQSQQQQLQLQAEHYQSQKQQQDKLRQRHQQRQQVIKDELEALAEDAMENDDELQKEQLQQALEQREQAQEILQQRREQLTGVENELHELTQGNSALRDKIAQLQQQLQNTDIELAKVQERTQAVLEALSETRLNLKSLLQELDSSADEKVWEQKLEQVQNQVRRLGAINLAAIDEAEAQKERKDYLDQQYDDLVSALETLEAAIRKIDKETRQRFKSTFDAINEDLQQLFPKVFGGGSASLELTDDDLLETGVAIMARPPGKKNSTIHLLSGGEKALTALSLVFAIFRLNPAPFCLLDEVDAPLDDANVGRFCRLVSEMSDSVQFIYISHNKVAMEMASHLAGVTMQEAGVSRLVAVDVEQAVAMTESE